MAEGATLWADLSRIEDPNGLPDTFSYRWVRVDGGDETDIPGATTSAYTLQPADSGKGIKVRVSWTDAVGFFNSVVSELKTSPVPQVVPLTDPNASERTIWSATLTVGGSLSTTSVPYFGFEYPFLTGKVGYGADVGGHLSDTQFTHRGVTYTVDHLTWDWEAGVDDFGANRSTPISLGISPLPYESTYGDEGEGDWRLLTPAGDQVGFKQAEKGALVTEVYIDYVFNQAFPTSASVVGSEVQVSLKVRNYEPKRMAAKNISRGVRSFEPIPLAVVGDILNIDTATIEDPNGIAPGSMTVQWWELGGSAHPDILSFQSEYGEEDYHVSTYALGLFVQPIVKYTDNDGFRHRMEGPRFGPVTHPTSDYPYAVESTSAEPGIKLGWITRAASLFTDLHSIPARVGTDIHRSERHDWGNYGKNSTKVGELILCDWDGEDETENCLSAGTVNPLAWSFVDETAEAGVSYSYWIKPYQEFFSTDGVNKWSGNIRDIENGDIPEPSQRVREYGKHDTVEIRLPLDGGPGSPTNPKAEQPNSGDCTGNCVRLTWYAADNVTYYKVLIHPGGADKYAPRIYDPTTTWDHREAQGGKAYTYRIVAIKEYTDGEGNSRTLSSSEHALVTIYLEDPGVPKQVRNLTATTTRISDGSAWVDLEWAAPEGFVTTDSNNGYLIEYRLDVPGRSEWGGWKKFAQLLADNQGFLDNIALEAWNVSGDLTNVDAVTTTDTTTGSDDVTRTTTVTTVVKNGVETTTTTVVVSDPNLPASDMNPSTTIEVKTKLLASTPVEWVPTRDKGTLNLDDTDISNDWILPFGITYEYRIRAVTGTRKGPEAITSARIPNQAGVPDRVTIFPQITSYAPYTHHPRPVKRYLEMTPQMFTTCMQFAGVTDEDGNPPVGYRLIVTSDSSRKWHHRNALVLYLTDAEVNGYGCGLNNVDRGGLEDAPAIHFLNYPYSTGKYNWMTVQAYNANGVGKGDGWGRGEIAFYHNVNDFASYIDRPENVGAEEQE